MNERLQRLWDCCLPHPCPTCGAKAGERCTNYKGHLTGEPHHPRKVVAAKRDAAEPTR